MGELLSQIRSAGVTNKRVSVIRTAIASLEGADRKDLIEAIKDPNITASAISRALAMRHIKLPAPAITRYRRGEDAHGID